MKKEKVSAVMRHLAYRSNRKQKKNAGGAKQYSKEMRRRSLIRWAKKKTAGKAA